MSRQGLAVLLGVFASCSRPAVTAAPQQLPGGMAGTFHLMRPDEIDAINLEVSESGWRATPLMPEC